MIESLFSKAIALASKAHEGQKRKNGEPYFNHLQRVAKHAGEFSETARVIGMLHDIVEDTSVTFHGLADLGFPGNIVTGVYLLTHEKSRSYLAYIKQIKEHELVFPDVFFVKLCDIEDNLEGATGTLRDKYELARYILET